MGELSVLNCGAGDMKFSFDSDDPLEVARASRVVTDMLHRGYMLFVEVDGKLDRVTDFDPETTEYIIADGPGEHSPVTETTTKKTTKKKAKKRVSAKGKRATGVAPTAGG